MGGRGGGGGGAKATAVKERPAKGAHGGGESGGGPVSQHAPGHDILDEVQRDFTSIAQDAREDGTSWGSPLLDKIIERQDGWGAPAQVVSAERLDEAVASGWTQVWRGMGLEDADQAAEFTEFARTGQWRVGNGIYGDGMYTSARRTTAEFYQGAELFEDPSRLGQWGANNEFTGTYYQDGARGGLMRIAIDPGARVVDYESLKAERRAWLDQWRAQGGRVDANLGDNVGAAMSDIGVYAASRGYDVIRVRGVPGINDGSIYPTGVANVAEADQYIILNRSATMIQEGE